MLQLDPIRMRHALGIAGSQGAGLFSSQYGSMVKRLHAGKAAQAGLYGAMLARVGYTGIEDILETPEISFLQVISEAPDPEKLTDGLGEVWQTERVGFKPYPTVGAAQSSLWGMRALLEENDLHPDDIVSVEVFANKHMVMHSFWEYEPTGVSAAQLNLPFLLAVMIHRRDITVDDFEQERIADPALVSYSRRVRAVVDPVLDRNPPERRNHVRIKVELRGGKRLVKEIKVRHGSAEDPLTDTEVESKFRNLAGRVLEPDQVDRICALVNDLESLDDVGALTPTLVGKDRRDA